MKLAAAPAPGHATRERGANSERRTGLQVRRKRDLGLLQSALYRKKMFQDDGERRPTLTHFLSDMTSTGVSPRHRNVLTSVSLGLTVDPERHLRVRSLRSPADPGASNKEPSASSAGLGLSAIAFSIYMFVIAVRNARLNRGIYSARSFFGYFAVGAIGLSPAFVDADITDDAATNFLGIVVDSLAVAVAANLLQVVLRKIFMRSAFQSKFKRPLPN
jgi:hypothetical protein